jgi:hypothetical protein
MSAQDDFDWRDRAVALASLGAAALSRLAFTTADVLGEKPLQPLEMQVLVALALQDSLAADPPPGPGTDWLCRALDLERWHVDEIVVSLERARLVRRFPDADELSVAITKLGLRSVESWLGRTRRHFDGWPPTRPDVDDVVD